MKKIGKVLIALGLIGVLLAAAVFYLLSNIDRIVAGAIEKYGSNATGTSVKVSSVRIQLKDGKGSISNLNIANPGGFSTPKALSLGNIAIAVDTGSITGDPVVIDKVMVSAPRVTYEINKSGSANINEIKKNVESFIRKTTAALEGKVPAGKGGGGEGKKILIRSLVVEGGEIAVQVAALSGKPLSASLPRMELKNVGGKGGSTPSEIAGQVLGPLLNQVTLAASRAGIGQYLGKGVEDVKKALEEKAREKLGVPGGEAAKGAEEAVKKLFGK
jgi:type II secretory pathway pseudopilin PulG